MPQTRSSREVGARSRSGCGEDELPLGRHAGAHGDVLVADEAQRLGRRPRLAREDDRRAVRELVPHAGHVADVRERQHDEPPVAGLGELADVARDRGHALVVVDRALRRAGRPAGPDDARRVGGRRCAGAPTRGAGSRPSAFPSSETWSTWPASAPSGISAPSPRTVTAGSRPLEDAHLLAHAEPEVDRGGDRPGPQRAEVAGGELDRGPEHQAHDVAGPHAEVDQRGGEAVGGPVEPRVGGPLLAVDVRLALGVLAGRDRAGGRRCVAALTAADTTGSGSAPSEAGQTGSGARSAATIRFRPSRLAW